MTINSWEHFAYDSRKTYDEQDIEMREDYKIAPPTSMRMELVWQGITKFKPMLGLALEYNCLLEIYHIKQKGDQHG